jgi:hypothetical protein
MRTRERYLPPLSTPIRLGEDDYVLLYLALSRAMSNIKLITGRTEDDLDGEVFTRLRQELSDQPAHRVSPQLRYVVGSNLHQHRTRFYQLDNRCKDRLRHMFRTLRQEKLTTYNREPVDALEDHLLSMRASMQAMKSVAGQAAVTRKEIDQVQDILDGKDQTGERNGQEDQHGETF